ncbi:MAG TPA: hypothetical protein VMV72_06130 [Verrucomicrobiae bacterium]|nr:hypothetical protein [Verrucomicrobiae bacterium]
MNEAIIHKERKQSESRCGSLVVITANGKSITVNLEELKAGMRLLRFIVQSFPEEIAQATTDISTRTSEESDDEDRDYPVRIS